MKVTKETSVRNRMDALLYGYHSFLEGEEVRTQDIFRMFNCGTPSRDEAAYFEVAVLRKPRLQDALILYKKMREKFGRYNQYKGKRKETLVTREQEEREQETRETINRLLSEVEAIEKANASSTPKVLSIKEIVNTLEKCKHDALSYGLDITVNVNVLLK